MGIERPVYGFEWELAVITARRTACMRQMYSAVTLYSTGNKRVTRTCYNRWHRFKTFVDSFAKQEEQRIKVLQQKNTRRKCMKYVRHYVAYPEAPYVLARIDGHWGHTARYYIDPFAKQEAERVKSHWQTTVTHDCYKKCMLQIRLYVSKCELSGIKLVSCTYIGGKRVHWKRRGKYVDPFAKQEEQRMLDNRTTEVIDTVIPELTPKVINAVFPKGSMTDLQHAVLSSMLIAGLQAWVSHSMNEFK